LYADDLIVFAESEESLHDKIVKWKHGMKEDEHVENESSDWS